MTIQNLPNKFTGAGDGVTVAFPFTNLRLISTDHLEVYLIDNTDAEILQTVGVDYTLDYDELNISGTVTFTIPPAADESMLGLRNTDLAQPFDIPTDADFDAEKIEVMSDNTVAIVQDQQDKLNRSLAFKAGSTSFTNVPEPLADFVLGWDSGGTTLENKILGASAADLPTISAPSDADKLVTLNAAGSDYEYRKLETVNITDDVITLAKLAHGTANQFIGYDGTGAPVDKSLPVANATTAGLVEIATEAEKLAKTTAGGTGAPLVVPTSLVGWTELAPVTLTGLTTIVASALPANITEINIQISLASPDTNSRWPEIELGDAGGIETSGYINQALSVVSATSEFFLTGTANFILSGNTLNAAGQYSGQVNITRAEVGSNKWLMSSMGSITDTNSLAISSGNKTLTGELTQIQMAVAKATSAVYTGGTAVVRYK